MPLTLAQEPSNFVFFVDISASMWVASDGGSRFTAVQEALAVFLAGQPDASEAGAYLTPNDANCPMSFAAPYVSFGPLQSTRSVIQAAIGSAGAQASGVNLVDLFDDSATAAGQLALRWATRSTIALLVTDGPGFACPSSGDDQAVASAAGAFVAQAGVPVFVLLFESAGTQMDQTAVQGRTGFARLWSDAASLTARLEAAGRELSSCFYAAGGPVDGRVSLATIDADGGMTALATSEGCADGGWTPFATDAGPYVKLCEDVCRRVRSGDVTLHGTFCQ